MHLDAPNCTWAPLNVTKGLQMYSEIQYLLGGFSGVLIGFTLGLVGGGGSIMAVPLMVVIGLESMVVVARRLYPRALLTPFTDNVVLTEADQRAYISYAKMQRHKGFQTIEARFEDTSEQPAVVDPDPGPVPTRSEGSAR